MKKCKFCKTELKHIGQLDPGMLIKEASIHRFAGIGVFILLLTVGLLISIPLWNKHHILAATLVAVFGGIGAYFLAEADRVISL